jgi:hypothetical protein
MKKDRGNLYWFFAPGTCALRKVTFGGLSRAGSRYPNNPHTAPLVQLSHNR